MPTAPALEEITTTEEIRVEPWVDPVVDELGYDPRSSYVESFWLPVLGPSATWLLRRLATRLDASPLGCDVDLADLARALGLGERFGRNAPFVRTMARIIDFEMARLPGPRALAVRRKLPPLPRRHVIRLPASLRAEHERLEHRLTEASLAVARAAGEGRIEPSASEMRERARQLALSLVDLGEDACSVEQQLVRWHFHPAISHDSAAWAVRARQMATSG